MLADTLTLVAAAGELIVEARTKAGLSQAELARRARIPRSVLSTYERGRRQPGADALARILEAAGFRLRIAPRIDLERAGRLLAQVMDLAETLPYRTKRTLEYPPLRIRSAS